MDHFTNEDKRKYDTCVRFLFMYVYMYVYIHIHMCFCLHVALITCIIYHLRIYEYENCVSVCVCVLQNECRISKTKECRIYYKYFLIVCTICLSLDCSGDADTTKHLPRKTAPAALETKQSILEETPQSYHSTSYRTTMSPSPHYYIYN